MKKYYIGIDLHQKQSTIVIKDKEGNVFLETEVKTKEKEFLKVLSEYIENSELVFEYVSQWYHFADLFASWGANVHIANAFEVKAISHSKVKTDQRDAHVLCDLLRVNMLPESFFAPAESRSLKELLRARMGLVRARTSFKNKVHSVLWKHGLTAPYKLFTKKGKSWLKSQKLNKESKIALESFLSTIEYFDREIEKLESILKEKAKDNKNAKLLMSVPGIGVVSALHIVSEIGDVHRFKTAKQLMSYAGLVPSVYSSGGKTRYGKITKRGNTILRWVFVEVAHHQLRTDKGLKEYYKRMKKKKGGKTAAVATARKLCAVVLRVLKDQRAFVEAKQWDRCGALH